MAAKLRKNTQSDPASGTPRKVLDAFAPPVMRIGTVALRPMSMGHFLALERISSPVLADIREASTEDAARALFLLTLPGDEAMTLAGDRAALDARLGPFASALPVAEIVPMAWKLAQHLKAAFETVVPGKEQDTGPFRGSQPKAPGSAGS